MQARFLKSVAVAAIFTSTIFCGCQKKTAQQIEADKAAQIENAVNKAQTLMLEDQTSRAVEILEKASSDYGLSASLCESLAYAYLQCDRKGESAIFFEKASDIKGGNPEMLFSAAKVYEQAGSKESAIKAYEKYLKIKPLDPVAWKALAKNLADSKQYQEALNAYLASVKNAGRNPNSGEAVEIGTLFVKLENKTQARRWLEAAYAASSPDNIETRTKALNGLIDVSLAEQNTAFLKEEIANLDKIAPALLEKSHPGLRKQMEEFEKKLLETKATLEKKEQDRIEAEKKALEEKAISEKKAQEEIEKAKADAAKKSAKEIKNQEEPDKNSAIEKSGESEIKDDPITKEPSETREQKTERLINEAYAKISNGDTVGAKKAANLAVFENSDSSEAWRALAKSYESSGERKGAYLAANEALIRNREDIDATLYYLRSASFVVSNEKLLDLLYSAREKFPQNPEIMLGLARTYNVFGDSLNAKYFYNMFLNDTPKEHPLYKDV